MKLLVKMMLVLLLVSAAFAAPDPCNVNNDCQSCVSAHLCGWCSTLVVYKDGSAGAHCASNDGSHPFACYGIFSTADCIRGYVCNATARICTLGQPGEGLPYQDCLAQCQAPSPPSPPNPIPPPPTPPAETYLCNETDYQCFQTTPGHGTSKELCEQECHAPSPLHPSPPPPPTPPPAPTFLCNTTNWECFETTPGHGTSPELCIQQCKPQPPSPGPPGPKYACDFSKYQCIESNATNSTSKEQCEAICIELYRCDEASLQCVIAPWPTPGIPLPDCQTGCKPHNVTPSDLVGLWRGVQINNGYVNGEWDANFENTKLTLAGPLGGLSGTTSYIGPVPRVIVQVKVASSSISGIAVGSVLSMIFQADGASPVTRYLMLASGAPNGPAPDDFHKALNMTSGFDWTLMSCQPGTACSFHMPTSPMPEKPRLLPQSTVDDPCMPYATCDVCLGHQFCGWCSVDVIYKDGTPGKRCAGWNSNGSRNQFDCHGVWHTDDCNDYQCLMPQGQCVKVPLGGGESKEDCEKTCMPAPSPPSPLPPPPTPPTPPAQTYLCNTTDYHCYLTTPGHGESPELCEADCHAPTPVHPSPPPPPTPPAATYLCNETDWQCFPTTPGHGTSIEVCLKQCVSPPLPPPEFHGVWRGLQIDNQYQHGEFGLTFSDTGFALTLDGKPVSKGVVYGAPKPGELVLQINEGNNQGKRYAAMYTETQGLNVLYRTLVIGSSETDMPTGWDLPWIKGGSFGSEFVFLQVNRL
eukprot:TRINITY_DN361_c0_g1_i1.p1 TRINITY_DN361_c0_g1~~TRINITY_DN361_c0_g1_i1.p1  ORF type:complete len:750 (+),score=90.47 TRINITY_DN361_c0_g1_i1:724-2973(+)